MSTFERHAVSRLLERAAAAGVALPAEAQAIVAAAHGCGSHPARWWAEHHPDDPPTGCCYGEVLGGPDGCTCWRPVFDVEQQPPLRATADDLKPRDGMCGDCAFRPGSPERRTDFEEEALFDLARSGEPFWCHEGMRRPIRWEHPDGRVVDGHPDDWQPARIGGVPYRADGRPGLLCAGWAAVGAKAIAEHGEEGS